MNDKLSNIRSQGLVEQEIYKLRYLQIGSEMSDSDLFTLIAKVFNTTGGRKESEQIMHLVQKLKTRERIKRES